MNDDHPARTLSVQPTVHVETFASHYTVTWKGGPLSQFVTAVRNCELVPPDATAIIDMSDTAGRQRQAVGSLSAETTIQYVRVEAQPAWTASWERRTSPTVSVSGAPNPTVCRDLHQATTTCDAWPSAAVEEVEAIAESIS